MIIEKEYTVLGRLAWDFSNIFGQKSEPWLRNCFCRTLKMIPFYNVPPEVSDTCEKATKT